MEWKNLFRNIDIPVIICRYDDLQVVYENPSAKTLLNPLMESKNRDSMEKNMTAAELLRMDEEKTAEFFAAVEKNNNTTRFMTSIRLYSGMETIVNLSAIKVLIDEIRYVQICIYSSRTEQISRLHAQALIAALDIAYKSETTTEAINGILSYAGSYMNVSRSYIFESTSETTTSNTYEWCADGIEPAIDQLKDLPKDEYTYDEIIQNGIAVTDDIRKLSPEDRAILEPQGIKSLAIIPIISHKGPMGYVGFDDCSNYRGWSQGEVELLQGISDIFASLLIRRDAERSLQYSIEILKTVTNGLNDVIYVTDLQRQQILFCNNTLYRYIKTDEAVGRNTREMLAGWSSNLWNMLPTDKLTDENGQIKVKSHAWEFFNQSDKKWYLVKDEIIKWIDGRDVILETATDITLQKEQEARLQIAADTDQMTGTFNREWMVSVLGNILNRHEEQKQECSVVFADLDGLKSVNDLFGHAAGDRMIYKFVNIMQSQIRKSDALCRWGGDEFVAVIRGNEKSALRIVGKIAEQVDIYNKQKDDVYELGFSYGIIEIRHDLQLTVDELIKIADERMYAQKVKKQKNRC